ncbi:Hemolysin-type calcium-binding repeat-containing protein [Quadrisphaera granulorum]|uniref:Hemolysin type calcium-binding protein n=1 Tax=Quadrisphaera granulorum TaxID=317664 RepID=A0A315ZP31_9ACTN|nr:hemolysin type calcium-binding protein [Quadrisphaera granulorum]SZE99058.1 Hemolysin-type calcium-binding repeat-containing protein [Quadrisphaera granulorum]
MGGAGNDRLVGTPGRDVIDGRGGDDVIDGQGGDDIILGGDGNDTLLGGAGRDLLLGGNGDDTLLGGKDVDVVLGGAGADLISGSFGSDLLTGGLGNDTVAGGPDRDVLWGEAGDDGISGGYGDDVVSGGLGADRVDGASGNDIGAGGEGRDACLAEKQFTCEGVFQPGTLTATISTPNPRTDGTGYDVTWSAKSTRGLKLIEIYVDDALVGYASASGAAATARVVVPVSAVSPGADRYVYAVATDIDGTQTASDSKAVQLPEPSRGRPAATAVTLTKPTPVQSVVDALKQAGLTPLEYRADKLPTPAPQLDPQVARQLAADGITPYVFPDQSLLYEPGSTPIDDQVADVTSYYAGHAITGTPLISQVVVQSVLTQPGLGALGQLGRIDGTRAEGLPSGATASAQTSSRSSAATSASSAAPSPAPTKTGRTAPPSAARASQASAATVGYWPKYGRFNVDTYSRSRLSVGVDCQRVFNRSLCAPVPQRILEPKAEVQHTLVWTRESLQLFASNSDAYEQNLTVKSPGRVGTRPYCNPFSEGNFYVRAETAKFTQSNAPGEAGLYNDDVTLTDACSVNEVTFGMAYPEKLLDSLPAGQLPVLVVRQESDRNDSADREFNLASQSLDRDFGNCRSTVTFLKKYCIGVLTSATKSATHARTGTPGAESQIGDVGLPACVVYSGWSVASGGTETSTTSRLCGGDRDGDSYDDQIDCRPDDPAINPGAVDIPNDGIDQNCDGKDLTVGSGEIQVTLLWNNDDDLDLHVTEPNSTEIWYRAPGPTSTGGRLDRDDNVNVCGRDAEPGGVENVYWPTQSSPTRGSYKVDVVQYAACGSPLAWTAEVRVDGELKKRETGTGPGSFSFRY